MSSGEHGSIIIYIEIRLLHQLNKDDEKANMAGNAAALSRDNAPQEMQNGPVKPLDSSEGTDAKGHAVAELVTKDLTGVPVSKCPSL